jgi:two-component system, cell cycle sensor histidine kinase and response regulator CckA
MKFPLHILHLEDDLNDAELIKTALESDGISCAISRVDTCDEFVAALELGNIDLVFSDYSLPAFDGLSATKIVQTRWPNIPVILVSGTLGEELAIDALKNGATDYVLKERLSRLVPAVRRAMKEVEARAERSRLNALFIEAQKMEVVGQLAGGVAHDFNNILAIIMGYSDLLKSEIPKDSPLQVYTEEIDQAAARATGLTSQLLVFSSKQTILPTVLDLDGVVRDLDRMLRRLIHENIEMVILPGVHIGRIKADSGYIGQVLMNLVVNARDAMPRGGKLTITTSNSTVDQNKASAHPGAIPGAYVVLSVGDTGTGMTEDVKARLFEAFFTTKPKGKGTGLGLATCQTIVQHSHGFIEVHTEIGRGTTFNVYFPRVEQSIPVAERLTEPKPLPGGTETLMVVEDDPSLRQLACGILRARGYDILMASNGQEALQVASAHEGPPIDLVLTDVVMPLMDGEVMAQWLKATYPDIRILFTSGYSDESTGVFDMGVEFLPKPYTPSILIHKVRDLLDKGVPPLNGATKGALRETIAAG